MKIAHVELVWETLSQFERNELAFDHFLNKLGEALETASVAEAKLIGEMSRELDFALSNTPERTEEIGQIIRKLKLNLIAYLKSAAN
jgi:hypothetical protein